MGATGYFTHPQCLKHEMGSGHPECPERLSAIEDRLLITGLDMALTRREAPPAALADVELAHGAMHVAALRGLTDVLREDMAAGGPAHKPLDPDTLINIHTWDAALCSAYPNRTPEPHGGIELVSVFHRCTRSCDCGRTESTKTPGFPVCLNQILGI